MTTQTYDLDFEGYWLKPDGLPAESGIYGVYVCRYNESEDTVARNRLIYIGESYDVRDRVAKHGRRSDWRKKLQAGEVLCFNAALISSTQGRKRAEAAMIYKHQPVCNTEYKDSFPFDTTTVNLSGRRACMHEWFTVYYRT